MRHTGRVANPPHGLIAKGPLVGVTFRPHRLFQKCLLDSGQPIPERVSRLMIDTGADVTVVHKHVAEDLGIPPLRLHPLVGISGEPQMRPVYLLSVVLGLSDGISREGSMTMDAQMIGIDGDRDAECSGVLGRDFLSVCRFYYDGPRGAFVIDCGEFDKRDSISEAIRPAGLGRS